MKGWGGAGLRCGPGLGTKFRPRPLIGCVWGGFYAEHCLGRKASSEASGFRQEEDCS